MALSFKSPEVDRLARDLARTTGETMTQAVEVALRERLDRERAKSRLDMEGVRAVQAWFRRHADTLPVTQQEWDEACGEDDLQSEMRR